MLRSDDYTKAGKHEAGREVSRDTNQKKIVVPGITLHCEDRR
jgi:hypothetical protein